MEHYHNDVVWPVQRLASMAEILDVRERKLVELSKENMDLQETTGVLRRYVISQSLLIITWCTLMHDRITVCSFNKDCAIFIYFTHSLIHSLTHSSGIFLWLPTILHLFQSLGVIITSLMLVDVSLLSEVLQPGASGTWSSSGSSSMYTCVQSSGRM